jgi:hypothetical protein
MPKKNEPKLDKLEANIFNEIAKNQVEKLPLIFGKWRYFQENGIQNIEAKIIDRLRKFFRFMDFIQKDYFLNSFVFPENEQNIEKDFVQYFLKRLYDYVFLFHPMRIEYSQMDMDMKQWDTIMCKDNEIKTYMLERLSHLGDKDKPETDWYSKRIESLLKME